MHTVPDCSLDGNPILLTDFPSFDSDTLARIVGLQQPNELLEDAGDYIWRYTQLPTKFLLEAASDGSEPIGGWSAAYARHIQADEESVRNGSPEYSGRDAWLRDSWCINTAIYPIFVAQDNEEYFLWDGHRRLAAAFFYGIENVTVLLGESK